jgi:putative IMPACT (imprinted ancient) family translation regulator
MNTERLFNLVMSDMAMDKLKLEDDLERVINNKDMSINDKMKETKSILYRISSTENAIATFSNLLNNNNKKENEN